MMTALRQSRKGKHRSRGSQPKVHTISDRPAASSPTPQQSSSELGVSSSKLQNNNSEFRIQNSEFNKVCQAVEAGNSVIGVATANGQKTTLDV